MAFDKISGNLFYWRITYRFYFWRRGGFCMESLARSCFCCKSGRAVLLSACSKGSSFCKKKIHVATHFSYDGWNDPHASFGRHRL